MRRNRAQPAVSSGHRSRSSDEASVRGPHQGQQSIRTASTGRTHDCKRPLPCTPKDLLPGGGHPHMARIYMPPVCSDGQRCNGERYDCRTTKERGLEEMEHIKNKGMDSDQKVYL